jgi:hypothetical protein
LVSNPRSAGVALDWAGHRSQVAIQQQDAIRSQDVNPSRDERPWMDACRRTAEKCRGGSALMVEKQSVGLALMVEAPADSSRGSARIRLRHENRLHDRLVQKPRRLSAATLYLSTAE